MPASLRAVSAALDAFLADTIGPSAPRLGARARYDATVELMDRALHRAPVAEFQDALDDPAREARIARARNVDGRYRIETLQRMVDQKKMLAALAHADGVEPDMPLTCQRIAFTVPRVVAERDRAALQSVDAERALQATIGRERHRAVIVIKVVFVVLALAILVASAAISIGDLNAELPKELTAAFHIVDAVALAALGATLFVCFRLDKSGLRLVPHPSDQLIAWFCGVLLIVFSFKAAYESYAYFEQHW